MKPLNILVVDDEEIIRETLRRWLEKGGHQVAVASDGGEAIEVFGRKPFDAVVTDLSMPRVGGEEVVRQVKSRAPQTVTVVLTGHGTMESAIAVLREGCDEYLLKPIADLDLLFHALERAVARRDALLMAAAAEQVSRAKDGILELVLDEFEGRLEEMKKPVEHLLSSATAGDPGRARAAAGQLQSAIAQLTAILSDTRAAARSLKS